MSTSADMGRAGRTSPAEITVLRLIAKVPSLVVAQAIVEQVPGCTKHREKLSQINGPAISGTKTCNFVAPSGSAALQFPGFRRIVV
jgi:hypothetical protein